jgi:hypothetical protein
MINFLLPFPTPWASAGIFGCLLLTQKVMQKLQNTSIKGPKFRGSVKATLFGDAYAMIPTTLGSAWLPDLMPKCLNDMH